MATNFGANITEAPQVNSAIPVTEGVKKPPLPAEAINRMFGAIGGLIDDNKQKRQDATLGEFIKKQLLVGDALAQGSPSVPNLAYAQTLLRRNLLEAMEANPGMWGELLQAQNAISGLPGAEVLEEGTQNEQEWKRVRTSLIDSGDVTPDASDEQVRSALASRNKRAADAEAFEARMSEMEMRSKELALGSAERKAVEEGIKEEAFSFVRDNSPAILGDFKTQLEKIITSGASPAEQQEQIEMLFADTEAANATTLSYLSSEDRSVFTKPFETLRDTYIKRATGQYTLDEAQKAVDLAVAQTEMLVYADPEMARQAVFTKMFGSELATIALTPKGANEMYMRFMAYGTSDTNPSKNPTPYVTSSMDKKALNAYLAGTVAMATQGDAEEKSEGLDRIKEILSSMESYAGVAAKDPQGAESTITLVDWFASPEFQQVVAANPELLENVNAAKEVLDRQYWGEVSNMVRDEFTKNQVPVPPLDFDYAAETGAPNRSVIHQSKVDTTSIVTVVSDEGGMKFVPIDPTNKGAVNKAADLNKRLRPVLNTQLRARAHLDGRTDYGAYFEEYRNEWLGGGEGESSGNLELSDFRQLASLTSNYGSLVNLVDATESGGSYDTLLNHQQNDGGIFEGVKITEMTVGEVINFSSAGGEYAEYSKGAVGRMATPMGRYQIVGATLKRVAKAMGIDHTVPFDQTTQDAMFAFLVGEALNGVNTLKGKRAALRGVWEGFKHASNEELDAAIEHFEG